MNRLNKLSIVILTLFLLISVALAFGASIDKLFKLDETEISMRAHYILIKGPQTFLDGTHYLAHPPLYEYTVALIFKLFGEHEIPTRMFGLICFVLIGFFLALTTREVLRNQSRFLSNVGTYLAVSLYSINPLLVQHSLIVDADTTGTALFTMLFVYLFIKYERSSGNTFLWSRIGLAAVIALTYLSKEITPLMMLFAVTMFRLFNKQWKRLVGDVIITFLFGLFIAWMIWGVYCLTTGTDPLVFIKYTLVKKTSRVFDLAFIQRILNIIDRIFRWPLYWVSAPFIVFTVFAIGNRIGRWVKTGHLKALDIAWMIGIVVWTPYFFFKGTVDMMKYQHPIYPCFILVMVYVLIKLASKEEESIKGIFENNVLILPLATISIAVLTLYYSSIGDYILYLWDAGYRPRFKAFINAYYRPIGIVSLIVLYLGFRRHIKFRLGIPITCLLLIYPINTGLNWNQVTSYTTAESWMNYGERGFRPLIAHLTEIVKPGDVVAIRNDMIYYLRDRAGIKPLQHMDLKRLLSSQNPKVLEQIFRSGKLKVVVIDKISMLGLNPENTKIALSVFSKYYYESEKIGDFKVFTKK